MLSVLQSGQPGLPSSSGLGLRPFKAAARVRIPLGAPPLTCEGLSPASTMDGGGSRFMSSSPWRCLSRLLRCAGAPEGRSVGCPAGRYGSGSTPAPTPPQTPMRQPRPSTPTGPDRSTTTSAQPRSTPHTPARCTVWPWPNWTVPASGRGSGPGTDCSPTRHTCLPSCATRATRPACCPEVPRKPCATRSLIWPWTAAGGWYSTSWEGAAPIGSCVPRLSVGPRTRS
jgi:hypothetical protein